MQLRGRVVKRIIYKSFTHLKSGYGFKKAFGFMLLSKPLFATSESLGSVAERISQSFVGITYMATGGCYIAGLAFSVTAILQFKQHKDNPTQITVGKPISLVFIAAALLFMPSVMGVAGFTMFGENAQTAGPTGQIFVA